MSNEKEEKLVKLQHGLAKHFNLSVGDVASVFTEANIDQAQYYFDRAESLGEKQHLAWAGSLIVGGVISLGIASNSASGIAIATFAAFQTAAAGVHIHSRSKLKALRSHLVADMKAVNPDLKL